MDRETIDRVRTATFPQALRGYDRHEVDEFLTDLAAWLASEDSMPEPAEVRGELEQIGEQTKTILTGAHDAARKIREQAEHDARRQLTEANLASESVRTKAEEAAERIREEADAYAARARTDADELRAEADALRGEADEYARQVRSDAEHEAARMRAEAKSSVTALQKRRARIAEDLRRLASEAAGEEARIAGEPGADQGERPAGANGGLPADGARRAEARAGQDADSEEVTRPIPVRRGASGAG